MNKDTFNLTEKWNSYYRKYMEFHTTCTSMLPRLSNTCIVTTKFDVDVAKDDFLDSINKIDFRITSRNIQRLETESVLKYLNDFFIQMNNHEFEIMQKLNFNNQKNIKPIFEESVKNNNIKTFAKQLNKQLEKKQITNKTIKI